MSLYASKVDNAAKVFDRVYDTAFGAEGGCYVGLQTDEDRRIALSEVKFYLNSEADRLKYLSGRFVGSDDGSTWVELAKIEDTPLDGWNLGHSGCNGLAGTQGYRYIKWEPSSADRTACDFAELEFTGRVVRKETSQEVSCDVVLKTESGAEIAKHTNGITYSWLETPKVTSVDKRYINWLGGEALNIYGSGFGAVPSNVRVTIDNVPCMVSGSVDSRITCTPGKRETRVHPGSVEVLIGSKGRAVVPSGVVQYSCKFSDEACWGKDFAPGNGDSLYVPPGENLLIDVPRVPIEPGSKL